MAKSREKTPSPDDVVRLVCNMRRDDRARLKGYCARTGEDMEVVGARWILERLAVEERKLSR